MQRGSDRALCKSVGWGFRVRRRYTTFLLCLLPFAGVSDVRLLDGGFETRDAADHGISSRSFLTWKQARLETNSDDQLDRARHHARDLWKIALNQARSRLS